MMVTLRKLIPVTILLVVFLAVASGCSKKQPVETEPPVPVDNTPAEVIPETTVPETPEVPDANAIDYKSLQPSEYGVEDVFFGFDRYDLDDRAMATLARDARILKEAGVMVLISGHCDERGTVEYNLALGEKRARAVRDYLVSLGVPASRMLITSYGENKPFATGHNEEAWAQNRRAHFENP